MLKIKWKPEWNKLLGTKPDTILAKELGVCSTTILIYRKKLKIPRYIINREGMKFGKWTVLHYFDRRGTNRRYDCQCVCGNIKVVEWANLMAGMTTQCNSCQFKASRKWHAEDNINGNIILERLNNKKFKVKCKCGNIRYVATSKQFKGGCIKCRSSKQIDTSGRMITYNNETHNMTIWASKIGITREGLRQRLLRMPLEQALR